MASKKGKDKKGKTTKGKKHPPQLYKAYDVKDGVKRNHQFCPKCGPGIFLAEHKNRKSCGKCNYTEFMTKS